MKYFYLWGWISFHSSISHLFLFLENLFFQGHWHFSLVLLASFLCFYRTSLYIKAINPHFFFHLALFRLILPYWFFFSFFFGWLVDLSYLEKAFLHQDYINVCLHFNVLWFHILDLNLCSSPSLSWYRDWIIDPVLLFPWLAGYPNPICWIFLFLSVIWNDWGCVFDAQTVGLIL